MNGQKIGKKILQLTGGIIGSLLSLAGIIIFWCVKMVGLALLKTSDFVLSKLIKS